MRYENIVKGKFKERPNRFIALVEVGGEVVKAHVKNTGRLRELLVPDAEVYLQDHHANMGKRKLRYSLIGVQKKTGQSDIVVNIDSQAPNKAVKEAMQNGRLLPAGLKDISYYKPECTYGSSRLDFYAEDSSGRKLLGEVKGVTLEINGNARFPDAPTERGLKHIEELIAAVNEGYDACIVFVIQMKGVESFSPNYDTHREFGEALVRAAEAGVDIIACDCKVDEDGLVIDKLVDIIF